MAPVLIISVTFVVMLSACMLALSINVLRKLEQLRLKLDADMGALRGEITAVSRGAAAQGKRVHSLQQRLDRAEQRQEEFEFKDVGDIAITQASKLVKMGADTEELVSTCGLSAAEATLVSLMHAKSTARKQAAA
jgi:hypothetical protein